MDTFVPYEESHGGARGQRQARYDRYDRLVLPFRRAWEDPPPLWVGRVVSDVGFSLPEATARRVLEWLAADPQRGPAFAMVLEQTPREVIAVEPQTRMRGCGFMSRKVSYALRWLIDSGFDLGERIERWERRF